MHTHVCIHASSSFAEEFSEAFLDLSHDVILLSVPSTHEHEHLTAPVLYCTPLMNIVINPSVTLLHLDDVVILVEEITFFFCNILSWSQNKGFALQQVFRVFGNGVWLILEVLTRFPLIESVHSLFVCLKLRCCFTAVPMLVQYSDECVVIQVSKMWSM